MENLTIKPSYVSLFSCIGPKCADSCCNDWMITFDKQSYFLFFKFMIIFHHGNQKLIFHMKRIFQVYLI